MKKTLTGPAICGVILALWLGGCASQTQKPSVVFSKTGEQPKKITTEQVRKASPAADKKDGRRENAGHLVADRTDYDFGTIEPKQKLNGKYILTNDGKETIEINKQIGKSCGCTTPKLDSYILKPGESTTLSFSYKASTRPGKVKKKVWVTTKPTALPAKLTLTHSAKIRKIMDIKPKRLSSSIFSLEEMTEPTRGKFFHQAYRIN